MNYQLMQSLLQDGKNIYLNFIKMKVAIHKPDYPNSFSHKWIEYCEAFQIDYFIVDCLSTDIIKILKEEKATHLLWHFGQIWKDLLTARNILFSAEMMGLKVFPDKYTSWHYDDKVSQKYLLEAMDVDIVNSYVFYEKSIANKWISEFNNFPVVAKLRRGSGSTSVRLLKSKREFINYSNRLFSRGLSPESSLLHDFHKRVDALKTFNEYLIVLQKIYMRVLSRLSVIQKYPKELGYIYTQDFIKGNSFDIRIIVIGSKAYGIKRMVRKNDFRASGSGNIIYDVSQINLQCVKNGFEISEKLKTQSIAIDYIFDESKNPFVTEISYAFTPRAYDKCEGFWDKDLVFHKGPSILEYEIIKELLID